MVGDHRGVLVVANRLRFDRAAQRLASTAGAASGLGLLTGGRAFAANVFGVLGVRRSFRDCTEIGALTTAIVLLVSLTVEVFGSREILGQEVVDDLD